MLKGGYDRAMGDLPCYRAGDERDWALLGF
jgi:hypothetical protein